MSKFDELKKSLIDSGAMTGDIETGGGLRAERIGSMSCGIAEAHDGELSIIFGINGRDYAASPEEMASILMRIASVVSEVGKEIGR